MNNKEDEGNSSPYEVFSDSDTDSDQAQRPRSPRAPTNGQGHQQICRCAQGSQTRRPYDFDDQSSGDNVVYYTDSSEYYGDEDGNYEAENDFSSEWSDDYNESNDSSEIIEEYNHEYNEANTRGLPDSETDADQAQESGSFCRCYALRICRCRSLSPNHADAISNEEFEEFLSPNINYDFDTRSSNDSDDSSLEKANQVNKNRRQRRDVLAGRDQGDESGSSQCETSSYYTDE